ncbi:MAG: 16S rRNA (guanine(966)-N(2))-methyltransferase RsmD [Actinomycetota bacterium]|nr:16S rRNA (guanine(966)-N(2))-methyltransferase RsmD [Actinomycetota bacterium]
MRVIAGRWRGRKLYAPAGRGTRPTTDRVREAIFDVLASMNVVGGAHVVDLFAGSGALGIEALSRGAARATFVDFSPAAVAAIERNLALTAWSSPAQAPGAAQAEVRAGVETADVLQADVVRADVLRWLATHRHAFFDLAFCDPPYAFGEWAALLGGLPAHLAVLESGERIEAPPGWDAVKERRYGTTLVTLVSRSRDGESEH